ncbi:MAG: hypothetical protein U5L72_17075 [Bacteroidales bacterium]|nr:hypothetical protein [Bacteroidales bacterium]
MMLRWNAVLFLFLIAVALLRASEPLYVPHGADAMGMAFAVTATPGHWNCFQNPALLTAASATSFSAGLENRFMMAALSSKAVSAVLAIKPAPLGIVATHYGNADYYRLFTGLGSAVKITDGIALGVQVDYISEHGVGEYRDVSHVTFETGMTCVLSSSLTLGLHLFNPLSPLNTLPSSIEAGLQWSQSDDFTLSAGGSKVSDEPLSVQCGLSWDVLDRLILRSGYMSSPSAFAFGIGFRTGSMQTDAGFLINSVTGVTSSVSIIWTIR